MRRSHVCCSCILAVACSLVVVSSGCSPEMRKKFVREKKTDAGQDALMPVLEPEEYTNAIAAPMVRYNYFYSLLRVWHKDALILLEDGASDRRMRYTLGQISTHLAELGKIVRGNAQQITMDGIRAVDDILAQYDRPAALRNAGIIRRDLQQIGEQVIKPLAFDAVREDLKSGDE